MAHALTPMPRNFVSEGRPRYFADAPVAMMSVSALICVVPSITDTWNGRDEVHARHGSDADVGSSFGLTAHVGHHLLAADAVGIAGKFSTSVVVVSCPPGSIPRRVRAEVGARSIDSCGVPCGALPIIRHLIVSSIVVCFVIVICKFRLHGSCRTGSCISSRPNSVRRRPR